MNQPIKPELIETNMHVTNLSRIVSAIILAHPVYLGGFPGDYGDAKTDDLMDKAGEIYDAILEKANEFAFN